MLKCFSLIFWNARPSVIIIVLITIATFITHGVFITTIVLSIFIMFVLVEDDLKIALEKWISKC